MSPDHHNPARIRPRFARLNEAIEYSAVSRSRLYQWAARRPELFRKNGSANLIDLSVLDEILDSLPVATLKHHRSEMN